MANAQKKPATPEEIWEILREVSESQRETDRIIKENARETEKRTRETDRIIKENARETKRLKKLFEDQWGKLMEALVKGDLIKLLNAKNIEVNGLARETSRKLGGKEYEFDIIAVNGDAIVAVEVKTTLRLEDVGHFVNKLEVFKNIFTEYKDKEIYGAVAYLKANHGSARNAEKQGLYVIEAVGSSSRMINTEGFRAKKF